MLEAGAPCPARRKYAVVMREAHDAWRTSLSSVSLADIVAGLPDAVIEKNRRLLG